MVRRIFENLVRYSWIKGLFVPGKTIRLASFPLNYAANTKQPYSCFQLASFRDLGSLETTTEIRLVRTLAMMVADWNLIRPLCIPDCNWDQTSSILSGFGDRRWSGFRLVLIFISFYLFYSLYHVFYLRCSYAAIHDKKHKAPLGGRKAEVSLEDV